MIDLPKHKKLILFDGICNFCNNSVLRIIKYDKKDLFIFTSLQSEIGKKITKELKIDLTKIDSIILYEPGISYEIKATAALKIMEHFGGIWHLAKIFWLIPEQVRNIFYDYIAKNRYKWFGKKESCMLPTIEIKNKFL